MRVWREVLNLCGGGERARDDAGRVRLTAPTRDPVHSPLSPGATRGSRASRRGPETPGTAGDWTMHSSVAVKFSAFLKGPAFPALDGADPAAPLGKFN